MELWEAGRATALAGSELQFLSSDRWDWARLKRNGSIQNRLQSLAIE